MVGGGLKWFEMFDHQVLKWIKDSKSFSNLADQQDDPALELVLSASTSRSAALCW